MVFLLVKHHQPNSSPSPAQLLQTSKNQRLCSVKCWFFALPAPPSLLCSLNSKGFTSPLGNSAARRTLPLRLLFAQPPPASAHVVPIPEALQRCVDRDGAGLTPLFHHSPFRGGGAASGMPSPHNQIPATQGGRRGGGCRQRAGARPWSLGALELSGEGNPWPPCPCQPRNTESRCPRAQPALP